VCLSCYVLFTLVYSCLYAFCFVCVALLGLDSMAVPRPITIKLLNYYVFFLCVNGASDKFYKFLKPFSVVDVRGVQVFQAVRRGRMLQ